MKFKYFLCVILFCAVACSNEKENQIPNYHQSLKIYSDGDNFTQGKQAIIELKLGNGLFLKYEKQDTIYAQLGFSFKNRTFSDYTIIKIIRSKNNVYIGKHLLPEDLSTFRVSISDGKRMLFSFNSNLLPVYKENGKLEEHARTALLNIKDIKQYYTIFEEEREAYPDNLMIYPKKWNDLAFAKMIHKDTVRQDYENILKQENITNNPNFPAMHLLVKTMLNEPVDQKLVDRMFKEKKASAFNFSYYRVLLDRFMGKRIGEVDDSNAKILEGILHSFPHSLYASRILEWPNKLKKIDRKICIDACNKRLAEKENWKNETFRAIVLLEHFLKDSTEATKEAGQKLLDNLYDEDYYKTGKDPWGNDKSRPMYFIGINTEIYDRLGDYDKALEIAKDSKKIFNAFSEYNFSFYHTLGTFYEKKGELDSALSNFMLSYKYDPSMSIIKKDVKRVFNLKKIEGDFDAWFETQLASIKLPKKKLPDNLAVAMCSNDEIVRLHGEKDKIVYVEFFDIHCGPCQFLIKDINNYMNSEQKRDDVEFLIMSRNSEKDMREYMKQKGYDLKFVTNSDIFFKKFGVSSVPESFVIDKKGRIANHMSGAGKEKLDFEALFKSVDM